METNYYKLEKSYVNEANFNVIKKWASNNSYNIKYKNITKNIDNNIGKINASLYTDIIIEKEMNNGKKRHAFIQVKNNFIYAVYKNNIENISNLVFGNSNIFNKFSKKNDFFKILNEPIMFIDCKINK